MGSQFFDATTLEGSQGECMIYPINRFEPEPEESPREQKYQVCISAIFDHVRKVSMSQGITMEECLGLLDVVQGSIKLNIALNQDESEDNNYDDYGT